MHHPAHRFSTGIWIRPYPLLALALMAAVCLAVPAALAQDPPSDERPLFRSMDRLEGGNDALVTLIASQQIDDTGQRHLTYNGTFPGPEIHVSPGANLGIRLYNALEKLTVADLQAFSPPVVGNQDSDKVKEFLASQSAVTNLHTHGFHVSPAGRADNVLLKIDQRRNNTYTYALPPDHAPGTHWYHAHLHGATALQVQGGMAGALIVDAPPGQGLNPPGFPVQERVLVMQFGDGGGLDPDSGNAAGAGGGAPRLSADGQELIGLPTLRINGLERPRAQVQQDVAVQRLRIINAGSRRSDYKSLWIEGYPMYLAAFDGVNLTSLPTNAGGQFIAYDQANPLVLAPGNRADVYFLPTEEGSFSLMMEGEIGLRDDPAVLSRQADAAKMAVARQKFVRELMTFEVSGPDLSPQSAAGAIPLEKFLKELNAHLIKLQQTTPYSTGYLRPFTQRTAIRRQMTFDIENSGTQQRSFLINDRSYNEIVNGVMRGQKDYLGKVAGDGGRGPQGQTPWPLRSGTEELWKITNVSTVRHPFHVHVSPFWVLDIEEDDGTGAIVSVRKTNPNDPRLDRWQDVIDLPPNGGSVTVQHRVSKFTGVYVIHCHILQHEDRGMMINVMTIPNQNTQPQAAFDDFMKKNAKINKEINGHAMAH
ncbi:MAG: multicopper oxidase family protein [Acidobacteriota bacterium]